MSWLKQNGYQVVQNADRENKIQLLKTVKQHSDMQHITMAIVLCMVTTHVCGSPASNQLLHLPPPPTPSNPTNPIPLHPCFLPGVVTTAANGKPFPIPFAMVTKERKNTTR